MNNVLLPLFWRVANDQKTNLDVVSVLMPHGKEADQVAIEYTIDVSFKPSVQSHNPIDLRWSGEDSELFVCLLRKMMNVTADSVELDIEDRVVQGLIQLVATARFHTPWPGDELEGEDFNTHRSEIEVGDLVAINTRYGFYSAVVVALDSIDATVVLLEDVVEKDSDIEAIMPSHSLLMINRITVLPVEFAEAAEGTVMH
jgi:hypothetical protein